MIRQSNNKQELLESLRALIPTAQSETHALDKAAALQLGINRTDLRCLGVVLETGKICASQLAETIGLSRGAMTTVLDRLERCGFIQRAHDLDDRRNVNIEATTAAKKAVQEIWGPVRTDGAKLLARYTDSELSVLSRFFEEYCVLQRSHAERIRRLR